MKEKHSEHIQLRLTPTQKTRLRLAASHSGLEMSEYVRGCLFTHLKTQFEELLFQLSKNKERRETLAELNSFLSDLEVSDWEDAVSEYPGVELGELDGNYVAAMVEVAAMKKRVASPKWTKGFRGLKRPYFSSTLENLRLHLLTSSPPPFRSRNIFIDSSIGDRV